MQTILHAQPKKDEVLCCHQYGKCVCCRYEYWIPAGRSRCDYNLTEGKWYEYEVPWHTGQAVYSLLAAYKATGNNKFLDAARRGGDYWISLEIKDHPVLKGMVAASHGDFIGGENYVFATVSDGTPGIYELSRVTKDPQYARVATNAASWMLQNMYYPERGVCYDVIDAKTGTVMKENSPFWQSKDNANARRCCPSEYRRLALQGCFPVFPVRRNSKMLSCCSATAWCKSRALKDCGWIICPISKRKNHSIHVSISGMRNRCWKLMI